MDPFSVSSGVAGLMSLGITVCKGLNIYCHDYRSRDVDILLLGRHAERLEAFLQLIKSRADGAVAVDHSLSNSFRECFAACDVCLQDFRTLGAKYSRLSAAQGLRERGKTVVRQLQYPFQKDKFDSLRSQMEDFRSAFLSLLLLMNHDLAKELQEDTKAEAAQLAMTICAHTQKTQDRIAAIIPDMEVVVERSLAKLDHSLQERLFNLENAIALRVQSIKPSLPPSQPGLADAMGCDRLPQEPGEHASIFEDSRNKHRLSADPHSLLRDQQEKEPLTMAAFPDEPSVSTSPPSLLCSCWVSLRQTRSRIPTNRQPRHDKQCALSFLNKNTRAFGGNFKLLRCLFAWKVTLRYSSSIMRDLSIQPNLTVRAVVNHNSGAHGVLSQLQKRIPPNRELGREDLQQILSQGLMEIHEMFKSGRAWPTDVDEYDFNLMDSSLVLFRRFWDIDTTSIFIAFLKDIVSLGVPPNDVGILGTPLRTFIVSYAIGKTVFDNSTHLRMKPGELAVAKELMRMDGVYGEKGPARQFPTPEFSALILSDIYAYCSDSINSFDYGALFQALIQKSEADVRRLLLSSTDLMFERGHDNQTPLHVAVCWPNGLRLLFELVGLACDSIIDVRDSNGYSAIEFAIFLHQTESVRILLDHSAAVDLEDTTLFGHDQMINRTDLRDLFDVLGSELGCRRKQLLSLALEHLPDTSISKLGLRSVSMIQNNTTEVINHLKLQLVEIPQFYQGARPGTIYHSPVMPVTLAESLFQAGFTEVDFLVDGYSPLMIIQLLRSSASYIGGLSFYPLPLINFFEEKGADIHKSIPHSSYSLCPRRPYRFRVIHRLAYLSGECLRINSSFRRTPVRLDQSDQCLQRMLASRSTDPCLCYCTLEGCSPASNYAKGYCAFDGPRPLAPEQWLKREGLRDLSALLETSTEGVAGQCRDQHVYDTIRVCTFIKLGMRHTCCRYSGSWAAVPRDEFHGPENCGLCVMEPAEVAEIREEDKHTAELLERLMAEFEARLQSRPEPLDQFVRGYWRKRMRQVEAEMEQIGADDIQAMREIGVRIESDSERSWENESAASDEV
ncbi:hypothetical protein CTA2_1277 [Colletotrichum tanaceti]|uniref:Uncharacterized protein n=1 Tax=Colletotrichum tanaceti TaxID=1306861 RepID=A0A4U6X4J4_9PEZI|nr:hypothetical protein CTA2_1276 [Colletotrichum tanaceti]KAJ0167663.1 hypothetical protein CTA2_1277 [Colletotrichum tanaceti]TKW50301.1 hypothetical protein CTA1_7024 [Colletotrichum tanaceti]